MCHDAYHQTALHVQRDDPWTVRILPKVHFGVHPVGLDGIEPDAPGITVLHHYLGTWKVRGGWSRNRIDLYRLWRKARTYMTPESRWGHCSTYYVDHTTGCGPDNKICL